MISIFKTVPLSKTREYKNLSQNKQILKLFIESDKDMTAWEVLRKLGYPEKQIVNVRRSISTLTANGHLGRTDKLVKEQEGEMNFLYSKI